MMYKHELIKRILELPREIETAENNILALSSAADAARDEAANIERDAILNGAITGKNETERKAQMAALTMNVRQKAADMEMQLSAARITYNALINEFRALQAIAQLLGNQISRRRI